ncbi:MAG TPA: GAF domain-containing protein, partial [Acetobacteraceae bacterium]|nr:GAF domain-containing protein [Acetobacteraceae bacterium]
MSAPADDVTTDPQSVIAALRTERDAALAREAALAEELAARKSDFDERIEHQAATIDVLKAMSASPGDPQPVFDLIVERVRAICDTDLSAVFVFDGELVHLRAYTGISGEAARAYEAYYPRPPTPDLIVGRAILSGDVVLIEDLWAEPGYAVPAAARTVGWRSGMAVPILRAGKPIGTINTGRSKPGIFSAAEVDLLRTFAEQAAIAITSAETYRALQRRTGDLQESLEYQTATSEVLKVISRSTYDLQPVLAMVAETAARLCLADQAAIFRHDEGDMGELAANFGFPPEYETAAENLGRHPFNPNSLGVGHRAFFERRVVHTHDLAAVPGYSGTAVRLGKQRTSLGVPLLREGEPVGVIVLARQRVEPFTERQIELVSTFADQAVIAIENTRLITEQREALEQQTATAEVLGVINTSPGNLAPVYDAMLEKAMHLCGAAFGSLTAWDGQYANVLAMRGFPSALAQYMAARGPRMAVSPVIVQLAETKRPQQIPDVMAGESYRNGHPTSRAVADLGGARTILHVPLRKDEAMLGYISVYR